MNFTKSIAKFKQLIEKTSFNIYWNVNANNLIFAEQSCRTVFDKRTRLIKKLSKKLSDSIDYISVTDILKRTPYVLPITNIGSSLTMRIKFKNSYSLSVIWFGPNLSYGADNLQFEIAAYYPDGEYYIFDKNDHDEVEGWLEINDVVDRAEQLSKLS